MKIGENAKVLPSPFYAPPIAPYAGQVGIIIEESTLFESTRYKIQFGDNRRLWFFESELEAEWAEQKRKCQKDLLNNSIPADDPKQSHLKAGFILCLGEL